MGASQIYSDVGSIKPFISGNLGTADAIDGLTYGFVDVVAGLIEELMESTTAEMQNDALMNPEWAPYAPYMKVEVEDGTIQYGYESTASISDEITNLEYGTPENAPSPFIRSFAVSNKDEFRRDLKDAMQEELYFG